jgi:SAM-dependent methyltransferase
LTSGRALGEQPVSVQPGRLTLVHVPRSSEAAHRSPLTAESHFLYSTLPRNSTTPAALQSQSVRILDVGCGINKLPGSIGIDRNPKTRADVLVDLDHFPYPFRDSSFDGLQAIHVIEHVGDVMRSMQEWHRLVRRGGEVFIVTPHYTDFSSFCDPTHKWHLNSFSLRYFGDDNAGYGYYTGARFEEISVRVKLLALWKYLGFEFLVNAFPRYRRFWEHYLCYVVRGKVIEWRLRVVKP